MKQLALLFGNGAYPESRLRNASNDAISLASKLAELGFETHQATDLTAKAMDESLADFGAKLTGYDVGLFFFAGHGMQIGGRNFLTAVDTNFQREIDAKFSSLELNKVIETMEASGTKMNILILDACRTNPYERRWRGVDSQGLAPVYAPKGMIVAYATSPGQVASDGDGPNGAYTASILQHIAQQNLSIETFFKRVRNTLSSSTEGRQISWEHTSLMGDYYFNSSLAGETGGAVYSDVALADGEFPLRGTPIAEIISELKSRNWFRQNPAVARVGPAVFEGATKDECFVLGRNLYQAACGEANSASAFLGDLKASLAPLPGETGFHVLNGMLFEIYFDRAGRFRDKPKAGALDRVFTLEEDTLHAPSFRFIQTALRPHSGRLFYIPGSLTPTCFDVVLVVHQDQPSVEAVCFEGANVLYQDGVGYFSLSQGSYLNSETRDVFRKSIAAAAATPVSRVKVSFVGPQAAAEQFKAPWRVDLRRIVTR